MKYNLSLITLFFMCSMHACEQKSPAVGSILEAEKVSETFSPATEKGSLVVYKSYPHGWKVGLVSEVLAPLYVVKTTDNSGLIFTSDELRNILDDK